METKIVSIDLNARSYDIYIGTGLLYRFGEFVPVELAGRRVFIVTDAKVQDYAVRIRNILKDAGAKAELLTLPSGEQTKSFKSVQKILQWLLDNGISRDSVVCAVGGGVVGDLTGFAASIVLRGVPYVQVPTTLLSQVDSSVGGKTGINVPQGKNLVGSFHQPIAVIADIETLSTLPPREVRAGYAEIVKYGIINDLGFFNWLESNYADVIAIDPAAASEAIARSVKAKATIVQADETEQGQRRLLNLGHTFGHALEAAAGYDGRLLHGEAVAIGIVMAMDLSFRMGLCSRADMERVEEHFRAAGLPTRVSLIQPAIDTNVDELMTIMSHDKKVVNGRMRFVVANGIGECFVTEDAPEDLVRAVLSDSLGGKQSSSITRSFGKKGVKGLWKSAFSSRS